ncbi:hypothetical protein ACVWYF_003320 [Hymenobacter sp. UYAg731]
MAKLPVEIVRIGGTFNKEIEETVFLLDNLQKEIHFSMLSTADEEKFQLLDFKEANADDILGKIKKIRNDLKGFHPYLIVISNTFLSGKEYSNLFGEAHPEEGVAIFTFNGVPETIIPVEKIKSYIAYYIARYTFNFLIPSHRNHDETRDCVFDMKVRKNDIIKSMKAGSVCDSCRTTIMSPNHNISAAQFTSLNTIFGKVEELYTKDPITIEKKGQKSQNIYRLFHRRIRCS